MNELSLSLFTNASCIRKERLIVGALEPKEGFAIPIALRNMGSGRGMVGFYPVLESRAREDKALLVLDMPLLSIDTEELVGLLNDGELELSKFQDPVFRKVYLLQDFRTLDERLLETFQR